MPAPRVTGPGRDDNSSTCPRCQVLRAVIYGASSSRRRWSSHSLSRVQFRACDSRRAIGCRSMERAAGCRLERPMPSRPACQPGRQQDGPRREDGGTGAPSRSCPIRYSWNDTDLAAANAVVRRDVYWGARRCGEQAHRVSVDRLLILCLTSDEH